MIDRPLAKGVNAGTIVCPTGSVSQVVARAWVSLRCDGGGTAQFWFQKSANSSAAAPGSGPAWTNSDGSPWSFLHAARPWHEVPDTTEFIQYVVTANGPGAISIEMLAH